MRDKKILTQELLNLLPENQQVDLNQAVSSWWFNIRKNGGMRLTGIGYNIFVNGLDLEHYQYSIDDPLIFTKKLILDLDRKLQMPYYIHAVKGVPKKIVFFGSKEAVMANLYGNLRKFIDNYQP